MAVLKKITFGSATTPIAQTVVTVASESALSVTGTNTGLNDNADPIKFKVPALNNEECEIVQSLAKW